MFGGISYRGPVSKFNIQKSYDEDIILIQYRKKPTIKNDDNSYDIIGLAVFEEDMTEISNKEVKMPYTESKMNNLDYSIDSRGFMYILSMVYKDNTQKLTNKEGNVNYGIELLRIDACSSEITHTPIKLGDNIYLNEIVLFNQKDNGMICAGYYTNNKKTLNNANGVLLFELNKDGDLSNKVTYEIPVEVLNMYKSKMDQKKQIKKRKKVKLNFLT
jgi:hypothetical protein